MKKSEQLAAKILEGGATWHGNNHPFDVWWYAQGRRVEVKTMNIKRGERKHLHADLHDNWGKNDYYMLMIYVDGVFDHCYLISSVRLAARRPKSQSISIPKNWSEFEFKNYLYAMQDARGIHYV